jgi:hypothetical protein
MNKLRAVAPVLLLCLFAVLFLSSFIWHSPDMNSAHDPILKEVTETAVKAGEFSAGISPANVPAAAKMDAFYARPWLEKAATAAVEPAVAVEPAAIAVPYSDALALLYARQYSSRELANTRPSQNHRLDFLYARQYGNWSAQP